MDRGWWDLRFIDCAKSCDYDKIKSQSAGRLGSCNFDFRIRVPAPTLWQPWHEIAIQLEVYRRHIPKSSSLEDHETAMEREKLWTPTHRCIVIAGNPRGRDRRDGRQIHS